MQTVNKVYVRFYIVRSGRYLECMLDGRWSFRENLKVIEELEGIPKLSSMSVYDPRKHLFLSTSCPIQEFGTLTSLTFFLY